MPDIAEQDIAYQPQTDAHAFSTNPTAPINLPPEQAPKNNNRLISFILKIIGLLTILIILLLALNFFNIISLSKIYPKQLNSLPHLSQTASKVTTLTKSIASKPPNALYTGPFADCPVEKAQCQNGQPIIKYDQKQLLIQGLEYKNLQSNTNILAVIPGDIDTQNITQDKQNFLQINITNKSMNTLAQYLIPSKDFNFTASLSSVMNNDVLGIFKNSSSSTSALLLTLQVINPKTYIILSIAKNGTGINSQ